MIKKVDVCINFYGKPYQTAVTVRTLWKHSQQHINKIYVIIEMDQPHNYHGGGPLLQLLLKGLPIHYYTPKVFYGLGTPPKNLLGDPEKRYGLNFQYAFEKTELEFLFLSHNDCLYQADLLGHMLDRLEDEELDKIAGVGLIGQCWNCPGLSAGLCDGNRYQEFKPTASELSSLVDEYHPPREAIHRRLIEAGYIHPLPECRLNEHACLINARLYNKNVKPNGDVLPLGGNWHGTDTGTVWFYQMNNLGYKFINFPFEPDMIHAPFASSQSGTQGDKDIQEYQGIEKQALNYLLENGFIQQEVLPFNVKFQQTGKFLKHYIKSKISKVMRRLQRS